MLRRWYELLVQRFKLFVLIIIIVIFKFYLFLFIDEKYINYKIFDILNLLGSLCFPVF